MSESRGPDPAAAITVAGIQCWDEEAEESFSRDKADGSVEATRTILTAWADRVKLATALLGGTAGNGTDTVTTVAAAYPDIPDIKAYSFKTKGVGARVVSPSGQVGFEWSRNVIGYRFPKTDTDWSGGDPLEIGSQELDFSSSAWATASDVASFKWTEGADNNKDVPPSIAPSFKMTTVAFTEEVRGLRALPVATILSVVDKSNAGTFLGAAAETLVFRGARSRRIITPAGAQNWDVTYFFEYFSKGWNKLYNPTTGWTSFIGKDGNKLFPPTSFSVLLRR